ncbi:DUF2187 domain-containing protein [Bacillus anthracis]|uniref:DUF2187 family protein n=1 Tax=Bacillus tropicus TaxID=2026188 RepID=UPI000BF398EF|nr:DUF2187 domain-containing protein [Bacillus anthracis]PFU31297.1 DUF2187 domain-containing protein [Bacillus anthracis]PGP27588.1 DUF2187 domain-containing protein [Bacillus anthracis]PGX18826.1 DUF2187 domain-containing protein [Bacillus anthracis]
MCKLPEVNKGDIVRFTYRDNSKLKLQGYVVSVLTNTVVVDVSEYILNRGYEEIESRQVVKHGHYKQRYK